MNGPLYQHELPSSLSILEELFNFSTAFFAVEGTRYTNTSGSSKAAGTLNPDMYFGETVKIFKSLRERQRPRTEPANDRDPSVESQEDAMEFLTYLLDQYHEVLVKSKPSITTQTNDFDSIQSGEKTTT